MQQSSTLAKCSQSHRAHQSLDHMEFEVRQTNQSRIQELCRFSQEHHDTHAGEDFDGFSDSREPALERRSCQDSLLSETRRFAGVHVFRESEHNIEMSSTHKLYAKCRHGSFK